MIKIRAVPAGLAFVTMIAGGAAAYAQGAAVSADRVDELQREIDILGQEVQNLKTGAAAAEPTANQMQFGFGPAASKVYRKDSGVSIGGYGEILYENFGNEYNTPGKRVAPGEDFNASNGQQQLDITRAVLYAGYKFSDNWVLNSEFEFEHAGAETDVEFLYLDYFWKRPLNFRVGNLLMPMGLTNETHEPTTYLGSHRPTLETLIIPTTWSEYGVGAFGEVGPVTYRTYLVTGFNASGFNAADGIQGGRYERDFANASRWGWVARADYTAIPGLLAGGSFYLTDATTVPVSGLDTITVPLKTFEAHLQYNWKAWDLRAMGAYSILSDVDRLDARESLGANQSIGSRQGGFYLEAGYDLLSGGKQSLVPFLRWETVDTQIEVPAGYTLNGQNLIREVVAGIDYKPIPQIVFKTDYQWYLLGDHSGVNQWNVQMGYVF